MLGLALGLLVYADSGLYNVIGYRLGHRLPLAPAVLFLYQVTEPMLGLLPLIILVFPEGRLPSPGWRWVLRGYLIAALADVVAQVQMSVYAIVDHRTQVRRRRPADPGQPQYRSFSARWRWSSSRCGCSRWGTRWWPGGGPPAMPASSTTG